MFMELEIWGTKTYHPNWLLNSLLSYTTCGQIIRVSCEFAHEEISS